MAYSNFTLPDARAAFQLQEIDIARLFSRIEPMEPSDVLTTNLERKIPLAAAIGTEKAKSEMIVADVLVELRELLEHKISLFSGIDFNVDEENGLTGVCNFVISLSPVQFNLEAPIVILVEAKNDNLEVGLGQCVAEMVPHNALMPKREMTSLSFMARLPQAQNGVSSNWKNKHFT